MERNSRPASVSSRLVEKRMRCRIRSFCRGGVEESESEARSIEGAKLVAIFRSSRITLTAGVRKRLRRVLPNYEPL